MALLITRKPGESFYIGDDIKITIGTPNRNGVVRCMIDAPMDIDIYRSEIKESPNFRPGEKPGRKTLTLKGREGE